MTWVNTLEIKEGLLFLCAVTLVLATGTGHEVLFSFTGKCLALWELLACALVWLSDLDLLGDLELLLCDFGEVLVVALGLDLRLGLLFWNGIGVGFWCPDFTIGVDWWWDGGVETILLFFLGNGLTGFLVVELAFASLAAPSVTGLLCVVAVRCQ